MLVTEQPKSGLVHLSGIMRSYPTKSSVNAVLHDISLSIPYGQSCAIVGSSGSGKSSLLNIIGLLDKPSSGHVFISGEDMSEAPHELRARVRNSVIGFIFQGFNLLPRLNLLDNVALPLLYRGVPRPVARDAAEIHLAEVGLGGRIYSRPADLSGGQRQRVAIARALVGKPALLLADEPTGNLDKQTAYEIVDLLLSLNENNGTTLVIVTHDDKIARQMQRCIQVHDGRIVEDRYGKA